MLEPLRLLALCLQDRVFLLLSGDWLQGFLLLAGALQFGVDIRQAVELRRDSSGIIKLGLIVQHQSAKNLVNAVELLESGSPVQQSKRVLANVEEPA